MWYNCFSNGGFWFPPLFFIIIVALLAYALWGKPKPVTQKDNKPSALELLDLRYAKGEINKDVYDKIKKDLH